MRTWFIGQMARYAAYHTDVRNELTHHVGVPIIVFSLFFGLAYVSVPMPSGLSETLASPALHVPVALSLGWLMFALLAALYLVSAPVVGLATALVYGVVVFGAHTLAADMTGSAAWSFGVGAFIVGWLLQFLGHAIEGRKPALLDNLAQALMAPPFLVSGVLFRLGIARPLEAAILAERGQHFAIGDPRRA